MGRGGEKEARRERGGEGGKRRAPLNHSNLLWSATGPTADLWGRSEKAMS